MMSGINEDRSIERVVDGNDLDINDEENGAGPPPIILHGGGETISRNPAFGAQERGIAPNLRGPGPLRPEWA